jgi:cholesterol transport system auxiliary component
MRRLLGAAGCALTCGVTACALSSKGEPLTPRYFSVAEAGALAAPEQRAASSPLSLRLGRLEAAAHLEERMAYRIHAAELGYYEDRRWTEPPEAYLRRALERELFEERGLRRIVSGPAPALDVELVGFEELRYGGERARVALRFTVYDDREAWLESSLDVERPLPQGSGPTALAVALSGALSGAVQQLAEKVAAELEARQQQKPRAAPDAPAPSE